MVTFSTKNSRFFFFNLNSLNQAVTYHTFEIVTLKSAVKLIKPGCFMSFGVDLRNSYYSIPMSPSFRKYLNFAWRDLLFQFCVLPMDLTSSPLIFTKLSKPVFSTLRIQHGHICLGYIDDYFYTADSDETCWETTLHAAPLRSLFCARKFWVPRNFQCIELSH